MIHSSPVYNYMACELCTNNEYTAQTQKNAMFGQGLLCLPLLHIVSPKTGTVESISSDHT